MPISPRRRSIAPVLAPLLLILVAFSSTRGADYLSPVALVASKDGKRLYVAEVTAKQVATVDLESGRPTNSWKLPQEPSGLAIAPDGSRLFVTAGDSEGKVYPIDLKKNTIMAPIAAGHTPMSPVISPDGKTLYVCNRFQNEVQVIDLVSGKTTAHIGVTREPVAAVLSLDGKSLFVANHLPAGAANVDRMTSAIDVIDTASGKVAASITLPNGAIDLRGMCLSPDGKIVYVPSIFARFMVPTTQIERGWMNTHALNLIDVEKRVLRHSILLDDVDLGAANPWGVVCTPDGKYICVAHSATHEISLIDQKALLDKLAKIPRWDESKLD
ncbi:MAG: cell surface protein, partial [Terrimicrobiaceae bacterium]